MLIGHQGQVIWYRLIVFMVSSIKTNQNIILVIGDIEKKLLQQVAILSINSTLCSIKIIEENYMFY